VRLRADGEPPAFGLCPEPNDLCVSKLARADEKDLEFVQAVVGLGLATVSVMRERLTETELDSVAIRSRIDRFLDWLESN
jgi:hypothetical protein